VIEEKKWHLYPPPANEAAVLEGTTGQTWQNAGWES